MVLLFLGHFKATEWQNKQETYFPATSEHRTYAVPLQPSQPLLHLPQIGVSSQEAQEKHLRVFQPA